MDRKVYIVVEHSEHGVSADTVHIYGKRKDARDAWRNCVQKYRDSKCFNEDEEKYDEPNDNFFYGEAVFYGMSDQLQYRVLVYDINVE